jgi:uncharacterized protein YecE (DUF72 family)
VPKVKQIQAKTQVVRGYFNNHYGAKAVINALEFMDMLGEALSSEQQSVIDHTRDYLNRITPNTSVVQK